MADRSILVITVTKTRSSSTVRIRSKGRYAALITNQLELVESGQPLFGTASEQAYWAAVLPIVAAAIAADPTLPET
jgi:hypothetical protein